MSTVTGVETKANNHLLVKIFAVVVLAVVVAVMVVVPTLRSMNSKNVHSGSKLVSGITNKANETKAKKFAEETIDGLLKKQGSKSSFRVQQCTRSKVAELFSQDPFIQYDPEVMTKSLESDPRYEYLYYFMVTYQEEGKSYEPLGMIVYKTPDGKWGNIFSR